MAVAFAWEGSRIGGLGRTTDDSVTFALACRGNSDASGLAVQLAYDPAFAVRVPGTYTDGSATSSTNFHNTAYFKGRIEPNRRVYWRAVMNGVGGPITSTEALWAGSFRAPPRKDSPRTWQIGVIGCTHLNGNASNDTHRYRAILTRRMADLSPDGIMHIGDTMYVESGTDIGTPGSYTPGDWFRLSESNLTSTGSLAIARTNHATNLADSARRGQGYSMAHLMSARPTWFARDDHELASIARPPIPNVVAGTWQRAAVDYLWPVMHEYYASLNKPLVDQTHVYTRDPSAPAEYFRFDMYPVRFLMLAPRDYHDIDTIDNAAKDLTYVLGAAGTTWFEDQISTFAALSVKEMPFLCVVSPIDWDGDHGYRTGSSVVGDNWKRSSYARQQLMNEIWDAGIANRAFTVTGDTHNRSVCYYQRQPNLPKLWAFCASHGIGNTGHDQTSGWGGRPLGTDPQAPVGWGGVPVHNVGSLEAYNNMLTIRAGVDSQGPWCTVKIWEIWREMATAVNGPPPVAVFSKTFRVRR